MLCKQRRRKNIALRGKLCAVELHNTFDISTGPVYMSVAKYWLTLSPSHNTLTAKDGDLRLSAPNA